MYHDGLRVKPKALRVVTVAWASPEGLDERGDVFDNLVNEGPTVGLAQRLMRLNLFTHNCNVINNLVINNLVIIINNLVDEEPVECVTCLEGKESNSLVKLVV
jgi:hypothetical protein